MSTYTEHNQPLGLFHMSFIRLRIPKAYPFWVSSDKWASTISSDVLCLIKTQPWRAQGCRRKLPYSGGTWTQKKKKKFGGRGRDNTEGANHELWESTVVVWVWVVGRKSRGLLMRPWQRQKHGSVVVSCCEGETKNKTRNWTLEKRQKKKRWPVVKFFDTRPEEAKSTYKFDQ